MKSISKYSQHPTAIKLGHIINSVPRGLGEREKSNISEEIKHYGDGSYLFLTKSDDKVYFVYLDNDIYFCSDYDAADMACILQIY